MHNYGHWKKTLALLVMSALSLGASNVDAMPEGGVVRSGSGSVTQNGKEMTIRQDSGRLAMDWTGFSVGKDETVRFQQPGKDALALNRVTGNQQSVIDGSLLSNGHVLLVNPNGVVIGKNASIDVGGLVASTAQVKDNFMKEFGNSTGAFSLGGVSDGKIINEGTIQAEGGLVALHAAKVENSGTISNTGGSAVLAAADTLTLTPDADGKLNFTVDGKAAEASALNKGAITADGGTIVMTADSASDVMSTVVNNSGTLQARTLRKNEKGQILLDGGDKGQVEVSGTLDASGMEDGQSAGNIKVIGEKTIVHDGTNLLARGAIDGGKIETSGDVLNLGDNLNIDAKGVNGKAGEWLLDPLDVIIADKDPTTTSNYDKADKKTAADSDFTKGSASIGYNDPAATDANVSSVNSAVTWISTAMVEKMLNEGTSVTVQAAATNGSANIIVQNDIDKTAGDDATFTLDAMRNITVNGNISSTSSKLNVVLNADSNGDKIGAVIINANINTNGGDFTSASGGTVTYAWDKDNSDKDNTKGYGKGKLEGKADPAGHTVGTYFGHVNEDGTADGKKDDRLIQTKGGKITLNGEIAIGLNGGTLTLDSNGGAVTATGIINSGNSYGAYVYGTDTWNTLVEDTLEQYLKDGKVPAYHYQGVNYVKDDKGNYVKDKDGTYQYTTDAQNFSNGQPHYTFSEADTQNVRWLGDGSNSVSTSAGTGYASVVITKGSMTLEQWLNYQLTYNAANFAKRYISQSSGVKVVTATRGGKTTTSVQNSAGKTMTTADLKSYITTAVESFTKGTASTDTTLNGQTLYANIKDDISHLLATNWFASKELAQGNTKGGSAAEDSYLATITTILENSLTTPNGQQILWAGGRGSGVLNKKGSNNSTNDKLYPYSFYGMPDDPTYQDGMYWVTGPEGEANDGKGTQFYSNAGSNWQKGIYGKTVYGYANWDSYAEGKNTTRYQPDNSAPFLTVGFGTTGKWDDAAMGGDTTVGFIKETNLANSSLNIKAGSGTVNLEGDLGKAKALDTVNIESIGAVTLGNPNNTATTYHNGTVYADHGVYISGGTVSVGGEIHSGTTDKTASASTITTRSDGYQNTAFQLDSVTIKSAGDLTVHGVESDGFTDSDSTLKGGKISLTSTGKTGTITLGAGVDYNGNATDGTLAAASAEQGAVVIDAQGSQGSLVNNTKGTDAITTGKDVTTGKYGTWQVYSASPDNNTFGTNLNSGTDAQWTSKSASNTIATENKYGKTPNGYSDTSSNKFIFQATPVITLYTDDYLKIYGDEVSADTLNKLLKGKEVFTGLDGKSHNVNDYSSAFQEDGYTKYISGEDTVTVTSDGSTATATRTGGKYEATDKSGADHKNAVYDLTVNLNDAKALDGYAIDTENGKLEIKKRTASITGTGTQTYGDTDGTIKNWTDTQTNIADGSTVSYTTSIKSDSDYTKNQDGRNTADHGTYNDSVSFDGLKITDSNRNEVDIADNYDLTTTGTIEVGKAKLTVNTDGKTTTYGTVDESYTSRLDDSTKALNGDDANQLLSDLGLTYKTDAYQDSNGDGKYDRTNHVKYTSDGKDYDSYTLDVANTKELKNYDVTVKDSTVTLERAKATVDTDKVTTDYGTVDTSYTSHFNTAVNGDNADDLLKQLDLSYSTDAYTDDTHTNDVKDGGYDLKVQANGSLTYHDYDVKINDSNVTLNKVNLTVNPEDIHRIYGQATEVQEDARTAYNLSGFANGDTKDTVDKEGKTIDQLVTVTNDVSKALKDNGTHTQNASAEGYNMETTASGDLTNYNIVIGDPKKVYLDKAKLTVSVNDTSTTYGQNQWTPYTYTLEGNVNGDTAEDVENNKISVKYTNGGEKSDASNDAVKTQNAGKYDLIGEFTLSGDTDTNYEIDTVKSKLTGTAEVKKADLTLSLKDVSTTYGKGFDENIYGYKKDKADLNGLTNGDDAKAITDALKDNDFIYVNGGVKSDPNNKDVKTQNAGSYQITGSTSKTLDNYNIKVVNPGTSTVEKAKLTLTVGDVSTVYGTGFDRTKYTYTISGNANGDTDETLKNNQISVNYTNTGEKADANNDKVKTQDVGDWKLIGNFTVAGDTANNYDVTYVDGTSTVTPAEIHLKLNDVSTTYGTAFTDTNTYGYDVSKLAMANGDSTDVVTKAIGNGDITYTNTGDATDPDKIAKGAKTQDAGTGYQLTGTTERTLKNYKVFIDGADATINKATLKLKVGDYTEAYGAADKVGADLKQTEVTGEQNGDDLADLVSEIGIHNTSGALLSDTRTNDVKYKTDGSLDSYRIDTQLDKDTLKNYNLELSEGTMTLTPVAITVDNEMIQTYGSADRSFKEIATPPLVNGDTISTDGLTMTPKAGGAYETNQAGRTTADAGKYENDLESDGGGIVHENGSDARKNYSVTIKGDIIVNPKDIYTEVNGKGSTLKDLIWEIVRNPKDQMVNGDSVKFTYTPGNLISYEDQTFDVNSFINGTQTFDSTTDVLPYGKNYIFHSTGKIQLTFNPIVKPDVWAHSGGYRPRNKIETSLPVFRVEDAKVGQYGTYGVEHNEEGDKLVLSATGMRLPEPDQVPDEERTFTTTLSTETGSGTFKLVYNGVSLKVYPQDKEAEETVRAGDKTKNVSLSEKALYVAYTEMGLDLIDLKGVYIYFN